MTDHYSPALEILQDAIAAATRLVLTADTDNEDSGSVRVDSAAFRDLKRSITALSKA